MKLLRSLVVFAFSALCLASCTIAGNSAKETDRGAGYKTFEIGDFNELIACDVDVYVSVGKATGELRLEADPAIIDDIEIANKRGALCINDRDDKSGKNGTEKARAYIYVEPSQLNTIFASADAEVILQQQVDAETFAIDATISVSPESFR